MLSRPASSFRFKSPYFAPACLSVLFGLALINPGSAETVRKECSTKYQTAKAAGTLNGQAWPQFYSQCAAEAKTGAPETTPAPAVAPPPANPLKPAPAPAAATPAAPAPPAPAAVGSAVFPSAVSAAHASEKPGKARMKTCVDQYNANKATNANGGLKWIQKGGGYYSQCNAKLKG
jgi:hypothetical protein